jgi:hypothetical protein
LPFLWYNRLVSGIEYTEAIMQFLEILKVVLLGIIEGVTEW